MVLIEKLEKESNLSTLKLVYSQYWQFERDTTNNNLLFVTQSLDSATPGKYFHTIAITLFVSLNLFDFADIFSFVVS